jgi:hypothetical protein
MSCNDMLDMPDLRKVGHQTQITKTLMPLNELDETCRHKDTQGDRKEHNKREGSNR